MVRLTPRRDTAGEEDGASAEKRQRREGSPDLSASNLAWPQHHVPLLPLVSPPASSDLPLYNGVPRIDPWGCHSGRLVEALSICGAVFLEACPEAGSSGTSSWLLPNPTFGRWKALWDEAVTYRPRFSQHDAVRQRLLSFNKAEDLARTLQGDAKSHAPDLRYNFGVTCANAMYRSDQEWGDLGWIAQNFRDTLEWATYLVRQELLPQLGAAHSRRDTLGAKLWNGRGENWTGSRLRHSVYPANGSCTEHTDYGVLTVQQSTSPGLEAFMFGAWRQLETPAGCAVAFAGDMLQLLTNGHVSALRHRVCLETPVAEKAPYSAGKGVVRQSHILFVQPDKSTVVEPLQPYRRNDGTDMASVKYGDWHNVKASLAFTRG